MLQMKHRNLSADNWLVYWHMARFLRRAASEVCGVIYDLGCGEKPYESYFKNSASEYVGVDWGNTLHQLKADIVASLEQPLPIESGIADAVVSFSVLEHVPKPEVMLSEAFRILKPGGKIFLQVPFMWWVHESPWDYFRYTPFGLRLLLENAGFDRIEIDAIGGFFTMVILKLNYFSVRFIRGPSIIRGLLKLLMTPIWVILQVMALQLDRLDREPLLEAGGYWVAARK